MSKNLILILIMKKESLFYENFFDVSKTIAKDIFSDVFYPWEILPMIKDFIVKISENLPKDEYEEIKPQVWIHKEAKVFDSAYIDGPTIVQKGVQIRHCAFIRGSVIIGENSVVGNSTEVKNAIIFNDVQIPHFNYVGDAILGYKAHMGAGSIISNIKSDKTNVVVKSDNGEKIETGLRKFGAIIGDFVEIGCNSVLNPGTIIGRNTSVYPTTMVRGFLRENTILKNTGELIQKR